MSNRCNSWSANELNIYIILNILQSKIWTKQFFPAFLQNFLKHFESSFIIDKVQRRYT